MRHTRSTILSHSLRNMEEFRAALMSRLTSVLQGNGSLADMKALDLQGCVFDFAWWDSVTPGWWAEAVCRPSFPTAKDARKHTLLHTLQDRLDAQSLRSLLTMHGQAINIGAAWFDRHKPRWWGIIELAYDLRQLLMGAKIEVYVEDGNGSMTWWACTVTDFDPAKLTAHVRDEDGWTSTVHCTPYFDDAGNSYVATRWRFVDSKQ